MLRDTLDIAYVLMVEEATVPSRGLAAARAEVDKRLLPPDEQSAIDDRDAMARLMSVGGMQSAYRRGGR